MSSSIRVVAAVAMAAVADDREPLCARRKSPLAASTDSRRAGRVHSPSSFARVWLRSAAMTSVPQRVWPTRSSALSLLTWASLPPPPDASSVNCVVETKAAS